MEESTVIPEPIKAGDKRVLVNGFALNVDFRIVSEDYYQEYLNTPKREWWMDLKEGDKFMANGIVRTLHKLETMPRLYVKNNGYIELNVCTPYIEPVITAESVISKHNLTEQEVNAIREGKCSK